jgi:2-hydroxy-6-oxonona-2,4-dienedioate hydrolase
MAMSRRAVVIGAGAAVAGALFAGWAFRRARYAAFAKVAQGASVLATPAGALEYAVAGAGPPILMLHGTGGGFDQGLRFGARLIAAGVRVVAPSRFGYLGSDYPRDAGPAAQADALVRLLDHLRIEALPVAGGSAGALPAAHLALRHPDRCSGLVLLVPAMNLENRDPVEFTRLQAALVPRLLGSDALFWAASRIAPGLMTRTLLGTDPALLGRVTPDERARAHDILNGILPVSARARGLLHDARMAGAPADIDLAAIRVPTLVVSAEDDLFGTAATARTIAARLPDARLVVFADGGHIWLGRDAELTRIILGFLEWRRD